MRHFTHTNEHTYSYIATFARHNIHRYRPVQSAKSCRPHYTHTHAHPHLLSTQHELTDYNKTGACTSTTTQVDSCVHQSPVMNIITPATNRLCTVEGTKHYITTSVNLSQEHTSLLQFEHPKQGEGCVCGRKRLICWGGQRRKRRSVHVCYVNICMFVHFKSIHAGVCGLCAHNCTCEWVTHMYVCT